MNSSPKMRLGLKGWLLACVIVVSIGGRSYWGGLSSKDDSIATFLVSCSGRKDRGFFLVLFAPFQRAFHIHRLDSKVQYTDSQKKSVALELVPISQVKAFVEKIFCINIQNVVEVDIQDIFLILRNIGGVAAYNLESHAYPKGRIVVDENNFFFYIDSIENQNLKKDVVFSLVISILQKSLQLDKILFQGKTAYLLQKLQKFGLFHQPYRAVWVDLVKNVEHITLDYSRMNVVTSSLEGSLSKKMVPLVVSGEIYDRRKIHSVIEKFGEKNTDPLTFPITVQVRNTTGIPRLAARTSGYLQRRKFLVTEFLNSSVAMKNSLIVSRTFSPQKLQKIQKYTKIYESYYIADYRESADFAVYLSKDFFMAK